MEVVATFCFPWEIQTLSLLPLLWSSCGRFLLEQHWRACGWPNIQDVVWPFMSIIGKLPSMLGLWASLWNAPTYTHKLEGCYYRDLMTHDVGQSWHQDRHGGSRDGRKKMGGRPLLPEKRLSMWRKPHRSSPSIKWEVVHKQLHQEIPPPTPVVGDHPKHAEGHLVRFWSLR